MLSICMKPSPTFHRSLTNPSKVSFYHTMVSGREVDHIKARTYSDTVEIPFDLLGDLVGKFATRYRQAVLSPVQYVNLPPHNQYMVG